MIDQPPDMAVDPFSEPTEETPSEPGWEIADLAELDRVLARMARLVRLRSENERVVQAEVARVEAWLEKEDEALAKRYRDLEAHVRVYAEANREALGKTRRLPHGTVQFRERKEGQYRWRQDMTPKEREAALTTWAQRIDEGPRPWREPLVDYAPKANKARVEIMASEATTADDQPLVPPGLEWLPPGESLSIVAEEVKTK